MNNNDKPNTENTSKPENTSQPEKEPQPEKVPQSQPQLVDSPVVRGMDSANSLAAKVLFTRGNKEFVDHVFADKDTGRRLSYAEMRMRYG
jgi:hypothetical protein